MICGAEHLFTYLLATGVSSMEKCPLGSFAHFPMGLFGGFFVIKLWEFLIDFRYECLIKYTVSEKYIFYILQVASSCCLLFPGYAKAFQFEVGPLAGFCFCFFVLLVSEPKQIIAKIYVKELLCFAFSAGLLGLFMSFL